MRIYYKSKSKSIFYETAASGGAVDSPTTIATSGTRVCLRSFDLVSGAPSYTNDIIKQSDPAYVYFEKMDASNTEILQMPIPYGGKTGLYDLGGGSLIPSSLITIPGPGILFDDGMRVRVTIPANSGTGPIFALVNVVYSV
tara:strand:+ start:1169 stop:1591 length:423 start_codon:yes stop_codon:yes gene_type:complete